jgi:Type III restriction enzyme, res subunit/RepB DNA-primase from phage plasmid
MQHPQDYRQHDTAILLNRLGSLHDRRHWQSSYPGRKGAVSFNYGTFEEVYEWLKHENSRCNDVFFTPNLTQEDNRDKPHMDVSKVVAIIGLFADVDDGAFPVWRDEYKPVATVQTTEPNLVPGVPLGKQQYFLPFNSFVYLHNNSHYKHTWVELQKRLAITYKTDAAICDLGRFMRCPGFLNYKAKVKKGAPRASRTYLVDKETYAATAATLTASGNFPDVGSLRAYTFENQDKVQQFAETLDPLPAQDMARRFSNSFVAANVYSLTSADFKELLKLPYKHSRSTISGFEAALDSYLTKASAKLVYGMDVNKTCRSVAIWAAKFIGEQFAPEYVATHLQNRLEATIKQVNHGNFDTSPQETKARERAVVNGLAKGLHFRSQKQFGHNRTFETNTEDTSMRYVSDYNIGNLSQKYVGLHSPTGTGKTTAIVELLRAHKRVLIVVHRIALANQWKRDMPELTVYNDENFLTKTIYHDDIYDTTDKLVISMDSLHKLRKVEKPYDVVVLDEADQSFSHMLLGNTTIRDNRRAVIEALALVVRRTTKVVYASAHLSDLETHLLMVMGKEDDTSNFALIRNGQKPVFRTNHFVRDLLELKKLRNDRMKEGQRLFICCDTATEAEQMHQELVDAGFSGICITSDTKSDHVDFLANIDEWLYFNQECRYVVVSPVLGTGYSIAGFAVSCDLTTKVETVVQPFDTVLGSFSYDNVISFFDCEQALARVRHPKTATAYIWVNDLNIFDNAYTANNNWLQRMHASTFDFSDWTDYDVFDDIKRVSPYASYVKSWQTYYLGRISEEGYFRKHKLMEIFNERGYSVSELEIEITKDDKRVLTKAAKAAKKRVLNAKCKLILSATAVDEEGYKELLKRQKRGKVTRDNKASIERYICWRAFRNVGINLDLLDPANALLPQVDALVDWYVNFGGDKTLHLQRQLGFTDEQSLAHSLQKNEALGEDDTTDVNRSWEMRKYLHKLLLAVKAAVNWNDGSFTKEGVAEVHSLVVGRGKELAEYGIYYQNHNPQKSINNVLEALGYSIVQRKCDGKRVYSIKLDASAPLWHKPIDQHLQAYQPLDKTTAIDILLPPVDGFENDNDLY